MKNKLSPLPVKTGVSPTRLWLPKGPWGTMLDFFLEQFPHIIKANILQRFQRNEVVSASGKAFEASEKYVADQHIYFYRELDNELQVPFKEHIIYQDENILVADKPHFLPVAPTGQYLHETLLVRLRNTIGSDELELCHRLDRETAGLVLLCKKSQLRKHYHALFSERRITKVYHALAPSKELGFEATRQSRLVKGKPYFRMKESEGPPNSETRIRLLEQRNNNCLYELTPITGKKHQLRVHMAALNMPIENDSVYPELSEELAGDFSSPLQLLAKSLCFVDPISGASQYFESRQSL